MTTDQQEQQRDIKQYKLVSGEEIIVSIEGHDPSTGAVIVYAPLVITAIGDNLISSDGGSSIHSGYALRPWITYADTLMQPVALASNSIIGASVPGEMMKAQYDLACANIEMALTELAVSMAEEGLTTNDSDTPRGGTVINFNNRTKH